MPPNYYAQQQPGVVTGRPPLVSIISPEDAKKIRKMQWVNFGCTMVRTYPCLCGFGRGFDRVPILQAVSASKQTAAAAAKAACAQATSADFSCVVVNLIWCNSCSAAWLHAASNYAQLHAGPSVVGKAY
jgi:hypothetical protein